MENPVGYLYQTAFNTYRRRLRRAALAVRRAVRLAPPVDELAEIEAREVVVRALATLTPRQREAVVLTDLLDLPSDEAAALMGIKAPTVRVLASQGRERLRREAGDRDA
jgi:RNA polymerase sigma factor (sigma-70 family)